MFPTLSNDTILEQLRSSTAQFELVSSAVASISRPNPNAKSFHLLLNSTSSRFFARVGPSLGGVASSNIKVERYTVQKVTGDGRCMFRALVKGMARNKGITLTPKQERDNAGILVKGMARNKGITLTPKQERDNADELRAAVKEVICDNENERHQYKEAVTAITVDEPLHRYCQRIERSDFWGGESELLVLSKLCNQKIIVYIPETEHESGKWGSGYIPIAEYGAGSSVKKQPRCVVRLVYSGRSHYDLLV